MLLLQKIHLISGYHHKKPIELLNFNNVFNQLAFISQYSLVYYLIAGSILIKFDAPAGTNNKNSSVSLAILKHRGKDNIFEGGFYCSDWNLRQQIIRHVITLQNRKSLHRISNMKHTSIQNTSPQPSTFNHRTAVNYCKAERGEVAIVASPRHLNSININLAKEKSKAKKDSKGKKSEGRDEKKTKRKVKKKCSVELDSTVVMRDEADSSKQLKRCESSLSKLTSKTAQKYHRNSSKPMNRSTPRGQNWFSEFTNASTLISSTKKTKGSKHDKRIELPLPKEQYLFINDQVYVVDKLCPTKRLIDTFRQACSESDLSRKFVAQDKSQSRAKLQLKRNNIFAEARKEIEMKNRNRKAGVIQKWWRRIRGKREPTDESQSSNPEQLLNSQFYGQPKIYFQESSSSMGSPFDMAQLNHSPIADRLPNNEDSIIASFNSVESMEEHPRKIQLTKESLNNLICEEYKLPEENQINSDQNQEIFSNYSNFRAKDSTKETQEVKEKINIEEVGPPFHLIKEFQEATRIKELIEERIMEQKGVRKQVNQLHHKVGINTNILSIHTFLVKFFNYYIQNNKDDFVNLLNMPFGYSIPARMRHHQGVALPESEEQDEDGILFGLNKIVSDQNIEEYYSYVQRHDPSFSSSYYDANTELERIHNRAVLDYFNEQLNAYRPYKEINGVPYPWNNTYKALTFYFVTEDNIAQIFQKTQIALLKSCSLLSGIHLPYLGGQGGQQEGKEDKAGEPFDVLNFMDTYETKSHGLVLQYNEDKEIKQIHEDIKKETFNYDCQIVTGLLFQISSCLFQELALEAALFMGDKRANAAIY